MVTVANAIMQRPRGVFSPLSKRRMSNTPGFGEYSHPALDLPERALTALSNAAPIVFMASES
jgi:hypothetical protein